MNARLRPWQALQLVFRMLIMKLSASRSQKDAASHAACDIILKVRSPQDDEIPHLKKDQTLICWAWLTKMKSC